MGVFFAKLMQTIMVGYRDSRFQIDKRAIEDSAALVEITMVKFSDGLLCIA